MKITSEDILKQVKFSSKFPEILTGIITRKIVLDTAEELGIQVEIEELQKAADSFRLANKLENANETYQWLEKHQLSIDEFEEMLHYGIVSSKLTSHLFADKVEPYFYEHQLDYMAVVMYEVILDDEDLAMELFYAIKEREISFYEVAHQYIQDTDLRQKLGYQGVLYRQDLKPEISAAVFAATPPQVLTPIETARGFHLIWVEEIIQPSLDSKLANQIGGNLFNEWLKQQKESTIPNTTQLFNSPQG
ncbi:peptidylprolyl isomerase [Desmonostoc muscorum LEGE 12446]|uniref:peptidylprolyl isomerase n=1 Tax=Desmonostoc muscorum LEGE 12446 TaxID=1828758 RepID=A0A8J7DHF7_DESMC|nr:peptidylprolyl isomerase [Desmonostoc muscorum]MCF2152111.1 peptidylprolyl isomerase [Desmonostoc muscorum LEGE 12446]